MGSVDAFDYAFTPLNPETTATLSMSTKESAQVSAIQKLLVAPVSFPDDAAFTQTFMNKLLASLLTKNIHPLKFVYESLDCEFLKQTRLFKPDYAKALVQWVHHFQASHNPFPTCSNTHSADGNPYVPPQKHRTNMARRRCWNVFVMSFAMLPYPHGSPLSRLTLVIHWRVQSKQPSGNPSLQSTSPLL